MSTRHVFNLVPLVILTVLFVAGGTASAQGQGGGTPRASGAASEEAISIAEVSSPNHVLKKTYFKTENTGFFNLTTTFVNAFSDTVVSCPGTSGTCAIAVTVSSQFGMIGSANVAQVRVFVNGLLTAPGDSCCLNLSRNAGTLPQTNTMTFVANGVPVGNRLVQVQFRINGGTTGYADYRTLEIRVFKP
jgi:hypothetical protein